VTVVVPDDPPLLTPLAAEALLRLVQHVAARCDTQIQADEGRPRDALRFGFYGRVSTEDQQDPEASRNWQMARAQALIEPHGQIVAHFFDIGQSRSLPWKRRPQAALLLEALKDPDRGFDAVVIGEPHRAFYGNQFGLTFPLFEHYGIQLWVPEVGGPVDPASEAHDLVMSVFGGMSKGERNRIKIRVRSAMQAQAKVEGRFLGGRPPYGYRLADAGPHPNPAKAADGKRLHVLELDPVTAPVVARIFAHYLAGVGIYALAEKLTAEDIPSPSAHDPGRNRHRSGIAHPAAFELVAGFLRVVAGVEVNRDVIRQRAEVIKLVQRGSQQRGVVPVSRRQDPAEGDAAALDQQGPLHAGFAPVNGARAGAFPAVGRLGDASVDREFLQDQADDPVIGLAGDLVQFREAPGPDPLAAALADRGCAAGAVSYRLI
jgi:DNA invertase Pin-like site-specific DNA recombinase